MRRQERTQRTYAVVPVEEKRGGPGSAGQSGDTQGLTDVANERDYRTGKDPGNDGEMSLSEAE